jgi:hypothetical protein
LHQRKEEPEGGGEKMRTAQEVRKYLEGVRYPARPEELIATAQANGAPPSFFETLGLVPTAVKFYNPGEVAEQLERLQGVGGSGKVTKQSMSEAWFPGIAP